MIEGLMRLTGARRASSLWVMRVVGAGSLAGLALTGGACTTSGVAEDQDGGAFGGNAQGGNAGSAQGGSAQGGSSGSAQGGSAQGGSGGSAQGGSAQGGSAQGGSSGSSAGNAGSGGSDELEQWREACVKRINDFRATESKPPLERWVEGEACADEQAAADANGGGAHGNFGDCQESAQNTCPGWGSYDQVIQGCLQQMWDEGPGEPFSEHGHYINMSSTSYTRVACGFYQMSNGSIWASQNFR